MDISNDIILFPLIKNDIPDLVAAFDQSGWTQKPAHLFEQYLEEQRLQTRTCFVAKVGGSIAGYVTLRWQSTHPPFALKKIPEICDLNVLPAFRKQGVGSELLNACEHLASTRSDMVGLGVGLYPDYGSAQRLYVKRGYIPDGCGATYQHQPVTPGQSYPTDDDLILWFTKALKPLPLQL